MRRSVRSWIVLGTFLALSAVPLPATAAEVRPVVTSHISFTGFDARVQAGAVVSVLQRCPAGSRLDRAATEAAAAPGDPELQSTVRRTSRELWPTGMVTRYRVLRAAAVPRDDGFGLVNTAVCTGTRPTRATSLRGRASTDVRVWGPAASGARVFSVTLVAVSDRPFRDDAGPGAELPYRTAVRGTGASASPGALGGGVLARQEAMDDDGSGSVMTTATTRRAVPAGRFVSVRSAYSFTADLTRRITVTEASPSITLESRTGRCSAAPDRVGAGRYEVVFVAVDGPASVVVRDARGAVVLDRVAVQEVVPSEGGGQPYGVAAPAVLVLAEGTYTIECRPDGAPAGTAVLRVTAGAAAAAGG